MRYLAMAVAVVCAGMVAVWWDTPTATAWVVAFCGWVPHCFPNEEVPHGNS